MVLVGAKGTRKVSIPKGASQRWIIGTGTSGGCYGVVILDTGY